MSPSHPAQSPDAESDAARREDLVSATIERYDIEKSGGDYFIVLRQFSSSRALADAAAVAAICRQALQATVAVSKLL